MELPGDALARLCEEMLPHLDERQQRLFLGAQARALGHGGIRAVARAAQAREATVSAGARELESGAEPLGRVRRPGGGRKRAAEADPGLVPALLALVDPDVRGDPMSPLRWTTKSTRKLAAELTRQGHKVGADTVADLLREQGFSLQGNSRTIEGRQHPDRDAQFGYINAQVKDHQAAGDPVISVDTKKKERVGSYANAGREYRPKGCPVPVRDHDFPDPAGLGKAVPYGVYDLAANTGWVNVGTDGDTAAFAVESIRRWWLAQGQATYPHAGRLLITADAGGSNGYRTRAWKAGLAGLATETGLQITCCHFPPGTSKWNAIEHRLFSHISMNWRGRPLTSHEVILNTIAATTTATGLQVRAQLDTGLYPTGVKISDAQMAALPLTRHTWHGDWNYTLSPRAATAQPATPPPAPRSPRGRAPARTSCPTPPSPACLPGSSPPGSPRLTYPGTPARNKNATGSAAAPAAGNPELAATTAASTSPTTSWPPPWPCTWACPTASPAPCPASTAPPPATPSATCAQSSAPAPPPSSPQPTSAPPATCPPTPPQQALLSPQRSKQRVNNQRVRSH